MCIGETFFFLSTQVKFIGVRKEIKVNLYCPQGQKRKEKSNFISVHEKNLEKKKCEYSIKDKGKRLKKVKTKR